MTEPLIHDLAAEGAVISTALLQPEQIAELRSILPDPAAFYSDANRRIWGAILDLDGDRKKVDTVTVAHALDQADQLRASGGTPYLAEVCDATPAVAHAPDHARIVRNCGTVRNLAAIGALVHAEAHGKIPDVEKWISERASDLSKVLDGQGAAGARASSFADTILDAMGEARRAANEKTSDQINTGFGCLDRLTGGIGLGEVWYAAGRPGAGKTSGMFQIATNVARRAGVAFVSMEVERRKLGWKAISQDTGIPMNLLRSGRMSAEQWTQATESEIRIADLDLTVIDQIRGLTPGRLRALLIQDQHRRRMNDRPALVLVFVDYLQLMTPDGKHDGRVSELEEITRQLKLIAMELDIGLVVACHLNRGNVKENREPAIHDLRGSGSIEQDADVIWFVHREDTSRTENFDGLATFIIAKSRNAGIGRAKLNFDGYATRFWEEDRPADQFDGDFDDGDDRFP